MPTILAKDACVSCSGRISWQDSGAHFYWPATSATVRFTGTTLSASVTANCWWGSNALGLVVDGRVSKVPVLPGDNGRSKTLLLAEGLEKDMEHTVILYKALDCSYDFIVESFSTDGAFLPALPKPDLRLEFYGDSVTSGACIECVDYVGRGDPCSNNSMYDNAWYGYAWQIGRLLNAEVHTVSQGGIAIFNRTGYFHMPDTIGMEDSWHRLCYFPEAGELTDWDFSRFVPHAVVFAVGQNDPHDAVTGENSRSVADPAYRAQWKDAYKQILRGIAGHYPASTPYVLMTTVLMHDVCWDEAIDEIASELRAEGLRASHFLFTRNGAATPGHPRIPEHTEMASELAAYLNSLCVGT